MPEEQENMYTFESRIRYSETDERNILTLAGVIDYFQDCSTFQSEDLGIGLDYLKENHLAWIVNYWQLELHRLPKLGERVRIGTSPYRLHGFIGERNFVLETLQGERLVTANSVWSLFDLEKMLPRKVTPEMLAGYELNEPLEMEYLPRKIREAGKGAAHPEDSKTEPSAEASSKLPGIVVSEQHLDSNHHVNNAQYIRFGEMVLEKLGTEERRPLLRLRAEYTKQARLGDVITPAVFRTEETNRTLLALNGEDGKPFCLLEYFRGEH